MSRVALRTVASASSKPAPHPAQKSCQNVIGGRGRSAVAMRRAQLPDIGLWRADFGDRWARLVHRRFPSVAQAAQYFEVTEQAVRYWLAGTSRPHGDIVALASVLWPEDFADIFGGRR